MIPHLVELWGPAGHHFLDETRLGEAYEYRVESLRDLIGIYDREIKLTDGRIHHRLRDDQGYRAIQMLSGVGRVHGAALVAEIGDVTRFRSPNGPILKRSSDTSQPDQERTGGHRSQSSGSV